MRFSSVLASLVCVFVLIETTCGEKWSTESAGEGGAQGEQYAQTVSRISKSKKGSCQDRYPLLCRGIKLRLQSQGTTDCRNLKHHLKTFALSDCKGTCGLCTRTCEDRNPKFCQKIQYAFTTYNITKCSDLSLQLWKVARRRCKKLCGRCKVEEPSSQLGYNKRRTKINAGRRWKQPFPRIQAAGDANTPRSGVYYIFTKQVSL